MKKYQLIKAMIFGTVVSLSVPTVSASADEKKFSFVDDVDWREKVEEAGKKIVNWSSEAEQKINQHVVEPAEELVESIDFYKHDSLWLITDIPEVNPTEKRNYYFVNKNIPVFKWTFYYDEYNRSVKKNSNDVTKIEIRELYVSITNAGYSFRMEQWLDCKTNTFTVNYASLDRDNLCSPEELYDYGKFLDIDDVIPEDKKKEKYSTEDLKEILEIINDVNYVFEPSNEMMRTRVINQK